MADWQAWIGRTSASQAWFDPAQANRMAATLDRAPGFRAGDPLPPGWHWLFFHDVVPAAQLGPGLTSSTVILRSAGRIRSPRGSDPVKGPGNAPPGPVTR